MPQEDGPRIRQILTWIRSMLQAPEPATAAEEPGSVGVSLPVRPIPPVSAADRAEMLRFAREAPLVYGRWRDLKWLYKHAETTQDAELLGILIGRLDAVSFPALGAAQLPKAVTGLNPIHGIAVQDRYAYVLAGRSTTLHILDVSDPVEPTKVGSLRINGRALAVEGTWAYIVDEGSYNTDGHLHVVDISRPDNPRLTGSLTVGHPIRIAITRTYALLLSRSYYRSDSGLYVVDVSDPAHPRQRGWLKIDDPADIAPLGPNALVVTHGEYYRAKSSVRLIDLSNPAAPRQIRAQEIDKAHAISVSGLLAYVACNEDWYSRQRPGVLQILDVSRSDRWTRLGSVSLGNAQAVAVSGSFAYVAVGQGYHRRPELYNGGLRIVDVADPRHPRLVGSLGREEANSVALGENGAVFTVLGPQLRCADLSDPLHAILTGDYPSRKTLGYMKRRARRTLKHLAQQAPDQFAEVAAAALRQSGHGRTALDPISQWVSMDLLYGGAARYEHAAHGRGQYILKHPRFALKAREERNPALWDRRPDLMRALAIEANLPWQTQEAALKMLRATGAEIPALGEPTLARFLDSPSPLLIVTAARDVSTRIEAGKIVKADLAADAYYLGSGRDRRSLDAFLARPNAPADWSGAFARRLFQRVAANVGGSRLSRRQTAGALLLSRRFPALLSADPPPALVAALFATRREELVLLALRLVQQIRTDTALTWLEALEPLSPAQREVALTALCEAIRAQAFTALTAHGLVHADSAWIREAGWRLLAASASHITLLSGIWQALLDMREENDVLRTALASPDALAILARLPLGSEWVLERLQTRPFLVRLLSPAAFEAVITTLTPEAVLLLIRAAPDEQWTTLREVCLRGLEAPDKLTAFWKAAWAAFSAQGEGPLSRRLLDDPRLAVTFLRMDDPTFFTTSNPLLGPLLSRWAQARTDLFVRDSNLLLAAATHPLPQVRDWGLRRVRELGMEMPFALRLLESELPPSVAAGRDYFEAVPVDQRTIEFATALCDSPKASVQAYGRAFVEARWPHLPTASLFARLAENADPQMQAFVAQKALDTLIQKHFQKHPETPISAEPLQEDRRDLAAFDRAVLRARDRGRRAKELVKKRLDHENIQDIPLLLEMARSSTPRDAEWAWQQLARLALEGHEIEGLTLENRI